MKQKISVILSAMIAAGCASTPVQEAATQAHEGASKKIADARASMPDTAAAPIILPVLNAPYLPRKSLAQGSTQSELPPALRSTRLIKFRTPGVVTAQQFAKLISEDLGIPVKTDIEAVQSQGQGQGPQRLSPVGIDLSLLPHMTALELLNQVIPSLGVDWDWQDGTLYIQSNFTRTYRVANSNAESVGTSRLGMTGITNAGTSGNNTAASGNFASQIDNTVNRTFAPWADIEATIKRVAGATNVVASKSLGSLTVTCSKACHKLVKEFVDNANYGMMQQVLLQVMEITVQSTLAGESGVNWQLVYRSLGDGRRFQTMFGGPASVTTQSSGFLQNIFLPTNPASPNNFDNSSFIFNAISSASKVVDVKPYTTIAINNETSTLTNRDQKSFVQSYTVVPVGSAGNPVFTQNTGYVTFGQVIQVTPTVLPNGNIKLNFALDDTKGDVIPGSGTGAIDRTLLTGFSHNSPAILKPGSTLVLSGFKRLNNTSSGNGLFAGQKMGSENGQQSVTETIIMVTPYLANVGI